jgi:hypothetical protein
MVTTINREGVGYVLIGGSAVIHGFVRATRDIDLLVDSLGRTRRPAASRSSNLFG